MRKSLQFSIISQVSSLQWRSKEQLLQNKLHYSNNMPRPYHQSQWRTTSTESFDPDSGLVFTEISCKGTPMTADWMWKTTGSTRAHGRFRSIGPGCDSLFNMALRSASLNSFSITAENLEILPWGIGQKLWECIRSRYYEARECIQWIC